MSAQETIRYLIDKGSLPDLYPTDHLLPEFWEQHGRAVGTFGALEEVLGKAIFALTGTRPYKEEEAEAAYASWIKTLERALWDPLGGLIDSYAKAARAHPDFSTVTLDELLDDLRKAAEYRNVICHGSWRAPDGEGKSLPLYVNRKGEVWTMPMGIADLKRLRHHVAELACEVMNTVWHMGLQFPGSGGPGKPVW